MRTVRLVTAALMAMALAIAPISAGFAKQLAGTVQIWAQMGAEMSMSAPDDACPGGDATHDHTVDGCSLKCCATVAILVEAQALTGQHHLPVADMVAAALAPFTLPPDPPPPRS